MPKTTTPKPTRHRHKRKAGATEKSTISAAVSLPPDLYQKALVVSNRVSEGNFSRYVRSLIKRDLKLPA